jgi:hypothetical protein
LEISYFNEQAVMDFETWVFVPESDGDAGPALFYWSKIPQDNPKPIRSVLGRAATDPRDVFAEDGDWQQQKICLFPEWSGRWFRVKWQLGDFPPIGTAPIDPPVRIYIDDLQLTTDAGCRAN